MATQEQVRKLVDEHVNDNVSELVLHLAENQNHEYVEEVYSILDQPDYVNPACDAGINVMQDDFNSFWITSPDEDPDGPYDAEAEAWQAACENHNIESYTNEAYEWYIVSDWMKFQLEKRGEMVAEIFGLNIWGRACSGQAIYLDYVMQTIYNDTQC